MALAITYMRGSALGSRWISISNVAYNSGGQGFTLASNDVLNSNGEAFTVWFENLDIPPFIPNWDDPAEVARATAAGRYFRVPERSRLFTVPARQRTFSS